MVEKPPSWQDIVKSRQREGFIGRSEEITQFQDNLDLDVDDLRRRFIFNIHGIAGVGKTLLVDQLRRIAGKRGALHAYVDKVYDAPEAMAKIAKALRQQDQPLERFERQYKAYLQRRHELEANLVVGTAAGSPVQAAVETSIRAARAVPIPVVSILAKALDEKATAEQAERFRSHVSRKLHNHEHFALVLSPVEILSPLFVEDLREAATWLPVALFFDTYEETEPFLDPWLLNLFDGAYGELPANLTLTIAGQRPLDPVRWLAYVPVLQDVGLDVFTEQETRQLLVQRGVTDSQAVASIIQESGRLPLHVALLADSPPGQLTTADHGESVVERFLRSAPDDRHRATAYAGAATRHFNEDLVAAVVPPEDLQALFAWLRGQSFVRDHPAGYQYHQVVRDDITRLQRRRAPKTWRRQHKALAEQYRTWRKAISGDAQDRRNDPAWWDYAVEETYHALCAAPSTFLPVALGHTLRAYRHSRSQARRWVDAIEQAGADADARGVCDIARTLRQHADSGSEEDWAAFLTVLMDRATLTQAQRGSALGLRGSCYWRADHNEQAIADFDQALRLRPNDHVIQVQRAYTYRSLGNYDRALADLDKALQHHPDVVRWRADRSILLIRMGRQDEAMEDFERLAEAHPKEAARILVQRGSTHNKLGQLDEAMRALDRAIALNPALHDAWVERGCTFREMGKLDQAMADTQRGVELAPKCGWAVANRGLVHRDLGRFDQAAADLAEGTRLEPACWMFSAYSDMSLARGRPDDALAQFDRYLAGRPGDWHILRHRGDLYARLGRDKEALRDFDRALQLNPDNGAAVRGRGQIYRRQGRHDLELASLDALHGVGRGSGWSSARRAELLIIFGRAEEAKEAAERAVELDPATSWLSYVCALTELALECEERAQARVAGAMGVLAEEGNANSLPLQFNLAVYAAASGDEELARRVTARLRALSADASFASDVPIDRAREILQVHEALRGRPMADRALGVLAELLALHPTSSASPSTASASDPKLS